MSSVGRAWHDAITAAIGEPRPDEPTEFGARVTADGMRWVRDALGIIWWSENGGSRRWDDIPDPITLGWGDEA